MLVKVCVLAALVWMSPQYACLHPPSPLTILSCPTTDVFEALWRPSPDPSSNLCAFTQSYSFCAPHCLPQSINISLPSAFLSSFPWLVTSSHDICSPQLNEKWSGLHIQSWKDSQKGDGHHESRSTSFKVQFQLLIVWSKIDEKSVEVFHNSSVSERVDA